MVYDPEGIAPCLCVGNHSGVEPKIIEIEHYEQDNRRKEIAKTYSVNKRTYRGGWMLDAYNQTYNKDVACTIKARIDDSNYYISVDEEVENTASNEERIY